MGLFSGAKSVELSSVLYNLAGSPEQRVRYLPTTVITKIISNSQFSLADVMREALLKGPGIRMRSYARWAEESGYNDAISLQPSSLYLGNNISLPLLADSIPHSPGATVAIQGTDMGSVDSSWWADQWMFDNHPDLALQDYISEYSPYTGLITITTGVEPIQVFTFAPTGMDQSGRYLYFGYTVTDGNSVGPVVTGPLVQVPSASDLPPTAGWGVGIVTPTPVTSPLVTTTTVLKQYSDGRPDETTSSSTTSTGSFTNTDSLFTLIDYKGRQPDGTLLTENSFMHQFATGAVLPEITTSTTTEVIGGVTVTTTTTISEDEYVAKFSYRIDSQYVVSASQSTLKIVIYKYGTGNPTYDAMFGSASTGGNFFAPIPVRLDNNFVSTSFMPDLYARNKKAYKKAVNSSYDKLVKTIEDNPSIGDIDYAYVQFGVPLNTTENASKKYIYKFIESLLSQGGSNEGAYNEWKLRWEQADISQRSWQAWSLAQSDPLNPLYGTMAPARIPYPPSVSQRMVLRADEINFNMRIAWSTLVKIVGTGEGWPGAKYGQVNIELGIPTRYDELVASGGEWTNTIGVSDYMTVTWQDTADTWRAIGCNGFVHFNTIYDGMALYTTPSQAMADPEDSSFIVPLQIDVFRSMSLKDASQMGMASAYMVFNCYEVNKQRWYQSGLFNVILIVVIIIVSVATGGAGASSAGLLGTAASVGASLGFTGLVALIVGTVANAIAAIILSQIIAVGANAAFGDQVGQLIGTIASIIAINVGSSMAAGKGFAGSFAQLSSAENLLKLTAAAGKGYTDFINSQTSEIASATQGVISAFEEASKKIEELYKTNLGVGVNRTFNPWDFLQASQIEPFIPESSSAFLSRTLLTGSDIANMTNNMLSNFADITTSTQLPT